jgi:hypothetical protein
MSVIYVKLKQRTSNNKYRKVLSTDEVIYRRMSLLINSCVPYAPSATLEEGEWFYVSEARSQGYTNELLNRQFESVDFDSLGMQDFGAIDFLFVDEHEGLYFQKVSKAKLIARKSVLCIGEGFQYKQDRKELVINDCPDAIYSRSEDRLYFRKLESITSIFKGIDQLFREATDEEVFDFLRNDFISLRADYDVPNVKTPNRKRIALAKNTLERLTEVDRGRIFSYIGEYCPDLSQDNGTFEIGTEDELKMLLYGIEQRFYTTLVGGEKRLANSVIPL